MHRVSRILPPLVPNTEESRSHYNFIAGVLNGTFYILAEAIMEPNLVLTTFVGHLTASPLWIGLIVPLRDGSWFLPQLWVSGFMQSEPRKMPLYRQMVVVRLIGWSMLVASVFTIRDPNILLVAVFASFGITSIASGVSGLPFLEIVGKTVPSRQRGEYFAWRLATGGLAGLGGSLLVRWMLDEHTIYPFPINFAILFAISLGFAAIGLYAFVIIHEPDSLNVSPRASLSHQLQRAMRLVRTDHNYRRFIYLRSALIIGGAATPFFAIYVQQTLDGFVSMIAVYLAIYTMSNLLSNLMFTRFASRLGNRRTMGVAALAGLLMTLVVLALIVAASLWNVTGWIASIWLLPVFALSGLRESGTGVAGQSLLLDIAPIEDRAIYLGFTNSFIGIILLGTGTGGVIVQIAGFPALLFLAIIAHIFGMIAVMRMKDSPQLV